MTELADVIIKYGIEIAVIIGEAIAIVKLSMAYKEVRDESDKKQYEQIGQIGDLTKAVNENTNAISKLIDKMNG